MPDPSRLKQLKSAAPPANEWSLLALKTSTKRYNMDRWLITNCMHDSLVGERAKSIATNYVCGMCMIDYSRLLRQPKMLILQALVYQKLVFSSHWWL